jgi:hypothetical protein
MSQVCHLYIHPHLFFIVFVQDIKHYLSRLSYLDGIKENLFLSKFLDLILYQSTLRITLRIIIVFLAVVVILGAMARGISNENCILAVCLPILLKSILKASGNILWTISSTYGYKLT